MVPAGGRLLLARIHVLAEECCTIASVLQPLPDGVVVLGVEALDGLKVVVHQIARVVWIPPEQHGRPRRATDRHGRHVVLESCSAVREAGLEVGHDCEPVVFIVGVEIICHQEQDIGAALRPVYAGAGGRGGGAGGSQRGPG